LYTGVKSGEWQILDGHFKGTPSTGDDVAFVTTEKQIGDNFLLKLEAILSTNKTAGFIFDQYSENNYKFAAISTDTDTVVIGHYTERSGFVIDTSIDWAISNQDHELAVTIKGSTVSVDVDGQTVLGYAFNALAVDGSYGLFSRSATASFDAVTISTNDTAYLDESAGDSLLASNMGGNVTATLNQTELNTIFDSAKIIWDASGLLGQSNLAKMDQVVLKIEDLDDLQIGYTLENIITIDINAAGHGWFVDSTPDQDEEFHQYSKSNVSGLAYVNSEAFNHMDLLTVVSHEIGHILGFTHGDGELMNDTLDAGVRIVPAANTVKPVSGSNGVGHSDIKPTATVENKSFTQKLKEKLPGFGSFKFFDEKGDFNEHKAEVDDKDDEFLMFSHIENAEDETEKGSRYQLDEAHNDENSESFVLADEDDEEEDRKKMKTSALIDWSALEDE